MNRTTWLVAAVLAGLVLAGCSSGGNGPDGAVRGTAPSCNNISQIRSYRYQIRLKLQTPAFAPSPGETPAPPLGAFAQALTSLFADMQMDGAYVAPDRSQVILTVHGEKLELRTIGSRSWVQANGVWEEQQDTGGLTLLTPDVVCQDIVADLASSLQGIKPQQEDVNGVGTDHYRLDKADVKRLPDLLGTGDSSSLPQSFQVELWLARQGGWPARLKINASDTDEQGHPMSIDLFMEFRDVNDPGIAVEPPA